MAWYLKFGIWGVTCDRYNVGMATNSPYNVYCLEGGIVEIYHFISKLLMYIFLSYLFLSHLWPLWPQSIMSIRTFAFVQHRQLPSQGRSGGSWGKVDSMEKLRPRRIIANKIASGNHHSMVWFFWSFFLVITFALTWFFLVIHQHTMLILREKKHTNKTMWCMWFRWSVDFLFLGDAKVCGPQKFWEFLVSLVRKLQQILQKHVTYSTSF